MAHPHFHAVSSVRHWGGKPSDYIEIHSWFDQTKQSMPDFRHRALRHHSEGIYLCEAIFGVTMTNSAGREVPVRAIGEQHVKEDMNGRIPTAADWLREIRPQRWMSPSVKDLEEEAS